MSAIVNILKFAAENVDSYVTSVQNTVNMDNGSIVALGSLVTAGGDLYHCAAPTAVDTDDLVFVYSPEVIDLAVSVGGTGTIRPDLTDPTLFTNIAGRPAGGFRLQKGDQFVITNDGLDTTGGAPSTTGAKYAIAVNGQTKLQTATTAPAAGTAGASQIVLEVVETTSISTGRVRVPATRYKVIKA